MNDNKIKINFRPITNTLNRLILLSLVLYIWYHVNLPDLPLTKMLSILGLMPMIIYSIQFITEGIFIFLNLLHNSGIKPIKELVEHG